MSRLKNVYKLYIGMLLFAIMLIIPAKDVYALNVCGTCEATGYCIECHGNEKGAICEDCDGVGYTLCKGCKDGIREFCGDCNGTGRRDCNACEDGYRKCNKCKGKLVCKDCKGTGFRGAVNDGVSNVATTGSNITLEDFSTAFCYDGVLVNLNTNAVVSYEGSSKNLKVDVFKIVPRVCGLTVNWSNNEGMSSYTVKYSVNQDMSKAKTINCDGDVCSLDLEKLKADTKYYVQIKATKDLFNRTCESDWSEVYEAKTLSPTMSKKEITMNVGDKDKLFLIELSKKDKVKWTSSDKAVIKVNKKGKLKAKGSGEATITAKFLTAKVTCKVLVNSVEEVATDEIDETVSTDNPEEQNNQDSIEVTEEITETLIETDTNEIATDDTAAKDEAVELVETDKGMS